jgi:hypothetical protein
MKSQIFKECVPDELLYNLIERIYAFKSDKYYIINSCSYKKAQYQNLLNDFLEIITPYYHISKRFYLKREMNYSSFMTILRQICKCNNIKYTSEIKYINSDYDILYYVYFKKDESL